MGNLKQIFYNKHKPLWYIVRVINEFMSTIHDLSYDEKEVIFIGDGRTKREQIEDLIELMCMDDGYGKYYIQIISSLIFRE